MAISHPSRDPAVVRRGILHDIPASGFQAKTYSVGCLAASSVRCMYRARLRKKKRRERKK
jgi:hypothetical protein